MPTQWLKTISGGVSLVSISYNAAFGLSSATVLNLSLPTSQGVPQFLQVQDIRLISSFSIVLSVGARINSSNNLPRLNAFRILEITLRLSCDTTNRLMH